MNKELEEIGVVKDSNSKVKISTAEYRDLVEAVATLKGMVEHEKSERWNIRSKQIDDEKELDLYKEFVNSEREFRERFYEFRMDKEREEKVCKSA